MTEWAALWLSLKLGGLTVVLLTPVALFAARFLAYRNFRGKIFLEALLAVPLVLPPTVIGYYLLVGLGGASPVGRWLATVTGYTPVFHFSGLVIASLLINIPFAVQPMQRAFETIPTEIKDAAACCAMSFGQTLRKVELPMAWPGILTAMILCFAHTLGEFGVVLMVGGNIPGETRTAAIAIYDRVQALDFSAAGSMSLILLAFSIVILAFANGASRRYGKRHGIA